MKLSQVAAQLYTCRDTLQDAAGIEKTLIRLRDIGYTAVQASGIGAGVSAAELAKILASTGMACVATHEPGDAILNTPEKVVDRLAALDCKITAYPFPAGIDFTSEDSVNALIAKLERSAMVFEKAGMKLAYHNHGHEFRKLGGRTILDLIYAGAPTIQGEPDTYWVQYGGGDPVEWCKKLNGRLPILHLKDYMVTDKNEPAFCEIGEGNLDFKRIIAAADESGCEWYAVEQDVCPGDPVESLALSFRYIRENLAR
jgi:sugar phosphate isomerase/epimerase